MLLLEEQVASGVPSRECADITIKVASSREEREGAFSLAYRSYLKAGLCEPCPSELRVTTHQLLPSSDVFVAVLRDEVISTLSLVQDDELGLPLETIYPREVEVRREAGLKLAEVTCLADRRSGGGRYFGVFSDLARMMTQVAEQDGVDELLIAVHPRHAKLYCRAMGFERIGCNRDYPAVGGNPAVALSMNLDLVREKRPKIWKRFVGEPLPIETLVHHPLPEGDREYFESVSHVQLLCQAG